MEGEIKREIEGNSEKVRLILINQERERKSQGERERAIKRERKIGNMALFKSEASLYFALLLTH